MFSLGGGELLLIAVVALLLFGPDKIPQMARTVGRFMREFNKYRDIMESTVRAEIYKDEWNREATEGASSATGKITQAADAVKDLVEAQRAKDAAAAAATVAAAEGADVAAEDEAAAVGVATDAVPDVKRSPVRATDEDEDEEDEV